MSVIQQLSYFVRQITWRTQSWASSSYTLAQVNFDVSFFISNISKVLLVTNTQNYLSSLKSEMKIGFFWTNTNKYLPQYKDKLIHICVTIGNPKTQHDTMTNNFKGNLNRHPWSLSIQTSLRKQQLLEVQCILTAMRLTHRLTLLSKRGSYVWPNWCPTKNCLHSYLFVILQLLGSLAISVESNTKHIFSSSRFESLYEHKWWTHNGTEVLFNLLLCQEQQSHKCHLKSAASPGKQFILVWN